MSEMQSPMMFWPHDWPKPSICCSLHCLFNKCFTFTGDGFASEAMLKQSSTTSAQQMQQLHCSTIVPCSTYKVCRKYCKGLYNVSISLALHLKGFAFFVVCNCLAAKQILQFATAVAMGQDPYFNPVLQNFPDFVARHVQTFQYIIHCIIHDTMTA